MTNKIAKAEQDTKIAKILAEHDVSVHVGDILIEDRDGDYLRVDKIYFAGRGKKRTLYIKLSHQWGDEWHHYGDEDIDEFVKRDHIKIEGTIEQSEAAAIAALAKIDEMDDENEDTAESDETALIVTGNADQVNAMKLAAEINRRKVEVMRRTLDRKVNQLRSIASKWENKLKVIHKIIGAIELYLGVYEEIVQIRDGNPAPADTTIQVMQAILFMDEEVGDPREKNGINGIDFRTIEDFDEWVADEKNLKRLFPGQKGIVAIRPSRQRRDYSDVPWVNEAMNQENRKVYLLIRNGDKLYRVWTSITMDEKLYPGDEEMAELQEIIRKDHHFNSEDARDASFSYKKNVMLLQGLFDRTEIFQPVDVEINLFKPETHGNRLLFIRDAEPSLTAGHEYYTEWKKRINSGIKRGSRVFLAREVAGYQRHADRWMISYREYDEPAYPKTGVYSVDIAESVSKWRNGKFIIYYLPTSHATWGKGWTYEPHERKNRLAFIIYPQDDFILNYDQVGLEDVEYFINSRLDRKNYLNMIPTLWGIRDALKKEIAWERDFVTLLSGRLNVPAKKVWEAVAWWKTKNIWKRPIAKDDALAWRMIERRLTGEDTDETAKAE